jgi:hypothetical protein
MPHENAFFALNQLSIINQLSITGLPKIKNVVISDTYIALRKPFPKPQKLQYFQMVICQEKLFGAHFTLVFIAVLGRFRKKSFWEDPFSFSYNML